VILVHLILVVAWACWGTALFLPALVPSDTGYAQTGWHCFKLSVMDPGAFLLYGVVNFLVIATPFLIARFHRRCPGWFAALASLWCVVAVAGLFFTAPPGTTAEIGTGGERHMIMRGGGLLWAFSIALVDAWIVFCWLASRDRR
jgi:hypothetical protein